MYLVQIANCSQFTDCNDCQGDPYCGWCIANKKCTRQMECEESEPFFGWLPREENSNACPKVVAFSPISVAADDTKDARVIIISQQCYNL